MSYASDPGKFAETVSPSDTIDLASPARSLYVGATGSLSVVMYGDGATVTFAAVPVGIFPIQVTRVNNTGTTASNIVALR
jgi:hypothetical protein